MKQKFELPVEVRDHYEGFCRGFLNARVRDRKLAKPRELLDDLCHNAPDMLRPQVCLPLHGRISNRIELLLRVLEPLTKATQAAYLGAWSRYEIGLYPLVDALQSLLMTGGAVVSIEPGRLAMYATEGCPRSDWYLLSDDSKRLAKAAAVADQVGQNR